MVKSHFHGFCFSLLIFYFSPIQSYATDICTDPADITYLVNRPANAVSPCTVPPKHFLIEAGYEHRQTLANANAEILPLTQLRLGLPFTTEIYTYLPTYIYYPAPPFSGNTTGAVGAKHEIWGNEHLTFTIDGLIVLPGGSRYFGAQSTGGHLNGIVNYNIDKKWNALFMLTYYNQAQPASAPNQMFSGIGPDVVLSYAFNPNMTVYGEIFGQSRVSATLGSGYNVDGGLIFTLSHNITVDIEYSNRLSGELGQMTHYIGAGGAIQL